MNKLEAITALCEIAKLQSEIIAKQAEALAQAEISDKAAASFAKLRAAAAAKLEAVNREYN